MGVFLILIGQQANFIHWIRICSLDKVIHCSYNRAQHYKKTAEGGRKFNLLCFSNLFSKSA